MTDLYKNIGLEVCIGVNKMDKTDRKDKKSGPSNSRSWFGKSWTMRLPRSKSREKLRMVLSKSSDRLDRKPPHSSTDCEGPSCDQTFDFTSRFCTECEMRQSCSRLCDTKLDRNPRSFSFVNDISENLLRKTDAEKVSSENVECTGSERFNLDSCLKRGSELGPDRKEPSAPVLNDDSMYTSRQGNPLIPCKQLTILCGATCEP